ncbi:MAG TPA: agmatinase [Syntrophales bacterium]|nr:agmatinase [Syntrophales bacterium]HOL58489.1 agmatinase [Syntrophales bacterium]HPO34903.1 agmatinase [Syntrophales bacterium]
MEKAMNFCGLDGPQSAYENSFFAVLPVPYDATTSYQAGTRWGPQAIISASVYLEWYDEELERETCAKGIYTAPYLEADARGPEYMVASVEQKIGQFLQDGKVPVLLGGEHSISLGAVRAMKKHFPSLSVLHLDAHADMRDQYQQSPFSHACVARRIYELCPIVQVGIRSMSREEADFIKEKNISSLSAHFVMEEENWIEVILEKLKGDVYVSIDVDCLDPAYMPATGTPEPGGLTYREVVGLMKAVTENFRVRGFDVVELSPISGLTAPDFLCARLVYRLMGYLSK